MQKMTDLQRINERKMYELTQEIQRASTDKEQDDIEIDKFILARFGKESGDFQIVDFSKSDLNKGFQYFKVLRKAYDIDREVSKLTRKLIKNERSK